MLTIVLNAGHAEYLPPAPVSSALQWDFLYEPEWNEDASPEQHADALRHFAARRGVPVATQTAALLDADLDPAWEFVIVAEGPDSAHADALEHLVAELAEPISGDDTVYDYWPSGVRLARQWLNALANGATGLRGAPLDALANRLRDAVERQLDQHPDMAAEKREELLP